MEQLSNEQTQSSEAQPQENHMGLANMPLVPLSEPPSATGLNGSQDSSQKELQDSQRRRSHASQSSPIRSREIIKAINDLTTLVCGAMAESQARIDTTIESLASLVASTKAMAEAQKMAAAQHHANMEKLHEKLLAAETQRHAAETQRHAAETKHQANMEKLHEKLLAAEAQRHADSEKLLAAIANKNNYVPGASSDA